MSDKDLYQQKLQAQLDEWHAEVDKLKAKASRASANAQMDMNKQIDHLQGKIEEAEDQLGEFAAASDDAWDSLKQGMDSAWQSLRKGVNEAVAKFK